MLKHNNFDDIDVTDNGQDLYNKVMSGTNYDIIFVDLKMPRMDGITAVKKINQLGKENLLMVPVTASMNDDIKTECKNIGMYGFILKPIRMQELKETLAEAIRRKLSSSDQVETP